MTVAERPATLAEAMTALQAALPRITKDETARVTSQRTGKTHTYTYVNLHTITDAVFPLLADLGLYWTCAPTLTDSRFVLSYALRHVSGDEISGEYPLPQSGSPQEIGSAITYARRYALTAVLGIAPADDDDDGQAAEDAHAQRGTDWRPPANPRGHKAERHNAKRQGPLPDDDWTTEPPGSDEPGSISDRQRARLMAAYGRAGISAREDRLAYAMSRLDLPELATSNDLSERQAGLLIAHLEAEAQ